MLRFGDEVAPDRHGGRIASLERDDTGSSAVGEGRVGVELSAGTTIERVKGGHGARGLDVGVLLAPGQFGVFVDVLDEHPELGAPLAEMVLSYDMRAKGVQHTS